MIFAGAFSSSGFTPKRFSSPRCVAPRGADVYRVAVRRFGLPLWSLARAAGRGTVMVVRLPRDVVARFAMATSGIVFIITCALFARSCWVEDEATWLTTDAFWLFRSNGGALAVARTDVNLLPRLPGWRYARRQIDALPPSGERNPSNALGFRFGAPTNGSYIAIPYWFIVALEGAVGAVFVRQWVLARRRRTGARCLDCGYDLRVTPGRCPACGRKTGTIQGG